MTAESAGCLVCRQFKHAHDVGFLHDQELLAIELDLGARPLAEQHAVAALDVDRDQLAGLVAAAGTDGDDLALLGLFLGAVRNDDAALGLFLGVDTLDHDTVMQRTKFGFSHGQFLLEAWFSGSRFAHRTWLGIRAYSTPPMGQNSLASLSNHALGVLIVRPGIWLDADPVKQYGGVKPLVRPIVGWLAGNQIGAAA